MRNQLILTFGATALLFQGAMAMAAGTPPLPAGWSEIDPGGETLCARGTPYAFFVRQGNSDKVIIDFIGGGACWDTDSCDVPNATFTDSVDDLRKQVTNDGLHGVYDTKNPLNPYKDYTHVVVPYCTGDVHWGSSDVTYKRADGTSFVIHHRGATNAQAVIDWVKAHYAAPQQMLVTGCSAGSYGSIFWTPKVKETFPNATIRQFGDSGVGVLTRPWQASTFPLWNVTASAPSWVPGLDPATTDYMTLNLSDFYTLTAAHYPDIHFAQYNNAFDFVQTLFYVRMGGKQEDWSAGMYKSIDTIQTTTANFSSYIGPGDNHCSTPDDAFYSITSSNVKLVDWLKGYVDGTSYTSVKCTDCGSAVD